MTNVKMKLDEYREISQKINQLISTIVNQHVTATYVYTDNNNDAHFIYNSDGEVQSILIPLSRLEECFVTDITSVLTLCESYVQAYVESTIYPTQSDKLASIRDKILSTTGKNEPIASTILYDLKKFINLDPYSIAPDTVAYSEYGSALHRLLFKLPFNNISSTAMIKEIQKGIAPHITVIQEGPDTSAIYQTPDLHFKINYFHDGLYHLTDSFDVLQTNNPLMTVGHFKEANDSFLIGRFIILFDLKLMEK